MLENYFVSKKIFTFFLVHMGHTGYSHESYTIILVKFRSTMKTYMNFKNGNNKKM